MRGIIPALIAMGIALTACSGETATTVDPANPPVEEPAADLTDISHPVSPSDQMREAAEQQCLDDPELVEGYVQAVEAETDKTVSEITVDCTEVRAEAKTDG